MFTEIDQNLHKKVVGFVVNSGFSEAAQECISSIQNELGFMFGGNMWFPPPQSLHITLMDWFAPLVKYRETHEELFQKYRHKYENCLEQILKDKMSIEVRFQEVVATSSAVIIKGIDDGSYARIRNDFLRSVDLLPETKHPPKIIHASIARFTNQIDLEPIQVFTESMDVNFSETVLEFRVVREKEIPMLSFEVLKSFSLG